MKTKNNVQKTNLKTLIVIFTLVLISIAVSAQKTERNLLADNLTKKSKIKTELVNANTNPIPNVYRKIAEQELQLENWMVYGELFNETTSLWLDVTRSANSNSILRSAHSIDESQMIIEKWMIESNFWK